MLRLSPSESQFICDGVACGVRCDGRSRQQYRSVKVETGVVPAAHGSAKVTLAKTSVLVGVKLEASTPKSASPRQGEVFCNVEWYVFACFCTCFVYPTCFLCAHGYCFVKLVKCCCSIQEAECTRC